MPLMLERTAYDTICHEHVEYYSLSAIEYILAQADLKIIDLELNDINGGSIAITAAKTDSNLTPSGLVSWLREVESKRFGNFKNELTQFANRVEAQRETLSSLVRTLKNDGYSIWGVGASTKGNVLLQYCGLDSDLIDGIADVNPYKFNRETPGTRIPIKSEDELILAMPDYAIVLPWHFKSTIIQRSTKYLSQGGKLIFPLPTVTLI
jgi:hypothetical protein